MSADPMGGTAATNSTDVFRLPDVGEGLTEAEIVGWRVEAGQSIAVNDVLVEIETAKSLVELPSPVDGTVGELLVAEGDTVEVGTPIIRFGPAAAPSQPIREPVSAEPVSAGPATTEPSTTEPSTTGTATTGEATDAPASGTVSAEPAALGPVPGRSQSEEVPGQPEAPAPAVPDSGAGTRSANLVGYGAKQGASAHRRRRLTVATPTDTAPTDTAPTDTDPGGAAPEPGTPPAAPQQGAAVLAKPPVRKLARELGVDLAAVRATGPGGTVTREDVAGAAHRSPDVPTETDADRAAPVRPVADRGPRPDATPQPGTTQPTTPPPGPTAPSTERAGPRETRVQVRSVRRMTAEAVTASFFSAPHVTEFLDVDVTRSYRLLDRLRARKDFAGLKVSPVLLVAKAMCLAVGRTPDINASWDGPSNEIVYHHRVNLGIAAATPRGLLVPNVKDADQMPLPQLCREINALVETARAGRTTPDQMRGGTITLTNVGVFGVDTGTPILNEGESAILAVGAIKERPWVHKAKVRPRKVMTLALAFDHRIVDGEQGSRFLADVGVILNDPATSLLWT